MNPLCNLYSFFKSVRGNWRNAIFIQCSSCSCQRATPCGGFLMTIHADGIPILISVKTIQQLSGETIDPNECIAILDKQTFETIYGLYIEWHTTSSSGCPLEQLHRQYFCSECLPSSCL